MPGCSAFASEIVPYFLSASTHVATVPGTPTDMPLNRASLNSSGTPFWKNDVGVIAADARSRPSIVTTRPSAVRMTMKPPPPIPHENGSVTPSTPAAVTAASMALPPFFSVSIAACVASVSTDAAAPPVPIDVGGPDGATAADAATASTHAAAATNAATRSEKRFRLIFPSSELGARTLARLRPTPRRLSSVVQKGRSGGRSAGCLGSISRWILGSSTPALARRRCPRPLAAPSSLLIYLDRTGRVDPICPQNRSPNGALRQLPFRNHSFCRCFPRSSLSRRSTTLLHEDGRRSVCGVACARCRGGGRRRGRARRGGRGSGSGQDIRRVQCGASARRRRSRSAPEPALAPAPASLPASTASKLILHQTECARCRRRGGSADGAWRVPGAEACHPGPRRERVRAAARAVARLYSGRGWLDGDARQLDREVVVPVDPLSACAAADPSLELDVVSPPSRIQPSTVED